MSVFTQPGLTAAKVMVVTSEASVRVSMFSAALLQLRARWARGQVCDESACRQCKT